MARAEAIPVDLPEPIEPATTASVDYLHRAINEGHARIAGEGRSRRIEYLAIGRSERLGDPEERVRAEYWAELIYRYGYLPDRLGIEVTVPDRLPRDAADIVIFHDDKRTRPFAVIECKRNAVSDSEFEQAVEQAAGNGTWAKLRADYVGVVAGQTRRFLDFTGEYGALEREANIIADLPADYGRPSEFKYYKGGSPDIRSVSRAELIAAIQKSHQTLWGGGRLSPPTAFGELCKLIFVKISDEQAKRKKGEPYEFQIKTHESSRSLAGRIRSLYKTEQERDPDVFTETIKIDDATLRTIVSHLEWINLSDTDLDTKGLAFEKFMDNFFKGDFGQYFTPRTIINFIIAIIQPASDDVVIDPACGSGGFLLYALDAVRREADEYYDSNSKDHFKHWHEFARRHLFGIEINDELTRVAKMNMIIHDDGHSNVVGADGLAPFSHLGQLNSGLRPGAFDLVLTNPPFGAQVALADRPYLAGYQLGVKPSAKGEPKPRPNQKTEILFLERIIDLLKPATGRAAVVLPDGVLSNSTLQYVRDHIFDRCHVFAVVSLPPATFAHYGATVKSSVLFLRRRGPDEVPLDDEVTFMALAEQVGYDATGRHAPNDLPEIAAAYRDFSADQTSFLLAES